jgi:predicted acyltransferase
LFSRSDIISPERTLPSIPNPASDPSEALPEEHLPTNNINVRTILIPVGAKVDKRLLSLDVMRGFAMACMILVNNPGSWSVIYEPLKHAQWHGWTPTDLVFPFFLFIVGVAMPFSFEKRLQDRNRFSLMKKVLQRTTVLFFIGFLLGIFPDVIWNPSVLLESRWPGVLQRIAICYFFTSLIVTFLSNIGRWIIAAVLLIVYSAGMFFYVVPGHGAGLFSVMGNFCWWLDNQLLQGHTWSGAPAKGFDPEGVWSTLPAITTTLFGYFTGQLLRSSDDAKEKLIRLFISANVFLILAYMVSLSMPINKQLWTVSFVFLTAGLAIHLLAMLYYLIDVREYRLGLLPFLILGTNAIVAYVLSSLLGDLLSIIPVGESNLKSWIFKDVLSRFLSPINASLMMAVCMVLLCTSLTSILYVRRIFVRV